VMLRVEDLCKKSFTCKNAWKLQGAAHSLNFMSTLLSLHFLLHHTFLLILILLFIVSFLRPFPFSSHFLPSFRILHKHTIPSSSENQLAVIAS
jgi:hypothetical protein